MSDFELDEDELAQKYANDPDSVTPEDVFVMTMLNKERMTKVFVQLEDKDGDKIELADMMEELINYMKDKMEEGDNQIVDQIMPLMSQALVSGLGRLIGLQSTSYLIMNPDIRIAIVYMMMTSFILYKMVQVKGLTINTVEEDVDEEDIAEIERKSEASRVANMSAMLGMDPREALEKMIENGDLTQEDLADLMGNTRKKDDGKDS